MTTTVKKEEIPIKLSSQETALKDLLVNLLYFHTWSGNESIIHNYLLRKLKLLGFKAKTDKAGNIYAERGQAPFVMLNAHMDIIHDLDFKFKNKVKNNKVIQLPAKTEVNKPERNYSQCAKCAFLGYCARAYAKDNLKGMSFAVGYFINLHNTCKSFDAAKTTYNQELIEDYEELFEIINTGSSKKERIYSYGIISDEEKKVADEMLKEEYIITYNKITGKISGSGERVLGGDDKCGIALALNIAEYNPEIPMKLLFTVGEECGCIGIKHFCKEQPEWFKDVMYNLTLDRRGNDNLLMWSAGGQNCSYGFAAELSYFGLSAGIPVKTESGTLADVIYIRDYVLENVNLSVGYHSPHTTSEYIDFPAMCRIMNWIQLIVNNVKIEI